MHLSLHPYVRTSVRHDRAKTVQNSQKWLGNASNKLHVFQRILFTSFQWSSSPIGPSVCSSVTFQTLWMRHCPTGLVFSPPLPSYIPLSSSFPFSANENLQTSQKYFPSFPFPSQWGSISHHKYWTCSRWLEKIFKKPWVFDQCEHAQYLWWRPAIGRLDFCLN